MVGPQHGLAHMILLKAGMSVCASQKLNTSFGPVMSSFGVSPLKKLETPSYRNMFPMTLKPDSDLEVPVLDPSLDDVQWRGDDQRRGRTRDTGDEVLRPGRAVVVLELVEVFFGRGRTAEEREGARCVAGGGPGPAAVEGKVLVGDDAQDAPATEGFGVGLALDLEDVEREEDDLANADETRRAVV